MHLSINVMKCIARLIESWRKKPLSDSHHNIINLPKKIKKYQE